MEAGALLTPLNWLVFQVCEPQKFTCCPMVGAPAETSPTTNPPPPDGGAAVVSVPEALAGL